jgi:hypothetical protein
VETKKSMSTNYVHGMNPWQTSMGHGNGI